MRDPGGECPACRTNGLETFHIVDGVPTNSCLLLEDPDEAREFPAGRLELAFCDSCGFITNRAFDAHLAEYSSRYEETQSCSPTFVDFGRDLAKRWVERHDLHGARILEVGCGKGEFLGWMKEAGIGSGVGIDPGLDAARIDGATTRGIEWIADYYDERYSGIGFDAFLCRHTLEHIQPVREFVTMVRENIGDRTDAVVLFEVPDTARVLEEVAFWDTYYEHCSYFSRGSLARLFRSCGFEILDLLLAYSDQYLLLDARPSVRSVHNEPLPMEDDMERLVSGVAGFRDGFREMTSRWRQKLEIVATRGATTVVWGGGSKAVSFLTSLDASAQLVAGAVDINSRKHARFIAGTGHPVLSPTAIRDLRPELVIAMNSIYLDEIRGDLASMGMGEVELVAL